MNKIVKKLLVLIFVLFLSCTPQKKDNSIIVYFDNGIINDSPLGFPDFLTIALKNPEMIFQLKDVQIDEDSYLKLEDAIKNGLGHRIERTLTNNNAKIKTIYLELKDHNKKLFFNSSNDFYNTENQFLFKNRNLANNIRNLINYYQVLTNGVNEDVPSPLYYKVVVQINDGKI